MKKRMNDKELSQFYHDLGLFAKSGMTLERGLDAMKKGKKAFVFLMMDDIQECIARGKTLWEGMSKYPEFFDEFQVMVIKAAEESGELVKTCKGLSRYFDTRHKEKKRLLAGLIYPMILLHGVIMLPPLKYLVVDSLKKSYWSIVLPPLVIAYGVVGLMYFSWRHFFRSGGLRQKIDHIVIKLPVIGKLAKSMSLARVMRSLASLHNAGVEPVRAARQAALTAGNAAITWRLSGALPVLERGGTFTDYFNFSGVLPTMQLGVVAVGEESGTLPESLERMVLQMEEDNRQRLTAAIKTLSYVIYFIAAAIVALTVISFYGGYFKLI
jgi:type II secretory pathway component PulF